jgi:hypothetical protein
VPRLSSGGESGTGNLSERDRTFTASTAKNVALLPVPTPERWGTLL